MHVLGCANTTTPPATSSEARARDENVGEATSKSAKRARAHVIKRMSSCSGHGKNETCHPQERPEEPDVIVQRDMAPNVIIQVRRKCGKFEQVRKGDKGPHKRDEQDKIV